MGIRVSSLLFLSLCGCLHAQRPPSFSVPPTTGVQALMRAFTLAGHPPREVQSQTGVLRTEWNDTGFRYGTVHGQTATLVRRYLAVLAPEGVVTLRAELKQCPLGGFSIGDVVVRGTCQAVDGVPETIQSELDALGREIAAAMGAIPVAISQ